MAPGLHVYVWFFCERGEYGIRPDDNVPYSGLPEDVYKIGLPEDEEKQFIVLLEQQRMQADLYGGRFDKNSAAFNGAMKSLGLLTEEGGTQGDLIITMLSNEEIMVLAQANGIDVQEMLRVRDESKKILDEEFKEAENDTK